MVSKTIKSAALAELFGQAIEGATLGSSFDASFTIDGQTHRPVTLKCVEVLTDPAHIKSFDVLARGVVIGGVSATKEGSTWQAL